MKLFLLLFSPLFFLACSSSQSPLLTVSNLEVERYAGQWHEIARLPNFFERGVVAARATYGVLPDGSISVLNEGVKESGRGSSISGKATLVGKTPDGEAKLKLRFRKFPASLFVGDYWILDLNDEHTHAIVGGSSRKLLWLLSKDPSAQPADFKGGIKRMAEAGFPMRSLIVNPRRIQ